MMLFLAEDELVIKDQIHLENGLAVVIAAEPEARKNSQSRPT